MILRFIKKDNSFTSQWMRSSLLALILLGQIFLPCNALSSGLLVVYPSVKAPYNKIYQAIIKGIRESYPGTTQKIELTANDKNEVLSKGVEKYQPDILITLGKESLNTVSQLKLPVPIVAGAITKTEQPVSGISMTPDPEVLLSNLLTMAPFVDNIYVVADINRRDQLERAEIYLKKQGKTLHSEEAESLQQAAEKYLKIINKATSNDAIWLMRGANLNEPSILMLILEAAWKKKIAVFSSNPSHVKRGALFSVYPDNEKMGVALAEIAQQHEKTTNAQNMGLVPLRNVHLIINKRTSKHLGIIPNSIRGLNIHRML